LTISGVVLVVAPSLAADKPLPYPRIAAGDSLWALGEVDRAEAEYKAGLAIAKDHQAGTTPRDEGICMASYGLARVALARKQPEPARKLLDSCKDKPKFEGQYLLAQGLVAVQMNDLDKAETVLIQAGSRLSTAPPGPVTDGLRLEVASSLVDLAEAKGVPGLAINYVEEIIALRPNDPRPLIQKGRLLVITKQYDEALAAFTQAVKIDTTSVDAYREVGVLFTRAKKPAQAAQALNRVALLEPTAKNYIALGQAHEAAKQPVEAKAAFEKALALDPASAAAQLGAARGAAKSGDRERALTIYQSLKDPSVLAAEDHENMGRALLDRKDYQAAREAYLRAVAVDSTRSEARYYVGYAYFVEQKYKEAIPYFEARVASDSTWAPAYANLGIALLQSGESARGLTMLQRAMQLSPDDSQSRVIYAQALMSQSQWAAAATEFKGILEKEPENPDALRGLGYCLLNQARYNEAADALARAHAAQPGNVQGMVSLAQAYGMAEQLGRAESVFRQVLAIDPGNSDARQGLEAIEKVNQGKRKGKS
jgi:tetratricopeptide (TPR) repeat protein